MNDIPSVSRYFGSVFSLLALCVLTLLIATDAVAGGYTGSAPSFMTVEQILAVKEKEEPRGAVSVKGKITQYVTALYGDQYMFADSTGSMQIAIPAGAWTQLVSASDTVELIVTSIHTSKDRPNTINVRWVIKR